MPCDSLAFSSCISICRNWPSLIFSAIAATSTFLAVVVTLIGAEKIRRIFSHSKMVIQIQEQNVPRTLLPPHNTNVSYFYMYLKNMRNRIERNVRVQLTGYSKKTNGSFGNYVMYPVPLQIIWAPAESTPPIIEINQGQTLDFLRLESDPISRYILRPLLYITPIGFKENIKQGDCLRFKIEIIADYYKKEQIFEIDFPFNPNHTTINDVGNDVIIKEIKK